MRTVTFLSDSSRKRWLVLVTWMVGENPANGYELLGSPLVLKNAWICFRTSLAAITWEGNNLSLQIHLFCKKLWKCYQTCNPTNGLSLLSWRNTTYKLQIARLSSYLPWNEAYKHSRTLSSHLLFMPCCEGKPNGRHFFAKFLIKQGFYLKILCLLCFLLPACRF